jgi:hypothetical protein
MSTVINQDELRLGGCLSSPIPIKRPAMVLPTQTLTVCPIDAVCVCQKGDEDRTVTCGYYLGTLTFGSGSQVVCGYGVE